MIRNNKTRKIFMTSDLKGLFSKRLIPVSQKCGMLVITPTLARKCSQHLCYREVNAGKRDANEWQDVVAVSMVVGFFLLVYSI